jgi:serine/threonine-protein kinase
MMPRSVGPYELVRPLGRGGMAEVFLARAHGASGFTRLVAIKRLAPELAGEPELERALIREATVAGALHHRNLVAVLGLGVDDGAYYVVMEYVDGGDLAARRGDTRLAEALALRVASEVALGLLHLHAARDDRGLDLQIVHRDVGPANVLVSTTGDVKLADFGLAKATALADLTAAGTRKGSYAYMAPEQLAGELVTAASDQFGLAVTLVELIAGRRPFAGDTPWATMDAIRGGAAALDGLAPDVAAVVGTALAAAPADRFASIAELRAGIEALRARRPPCGATELGAWVAARLGASAAAR